MNNLLARAGIKRTETATVSCVGCTPPDNLWPTDRKWKATPRSDAYSAVAYCREHHLLPAVAEAAPDKIITLGDAALEALTPRKAIMVWRGSPLPLRGDMSRTRVIPTLHPKQLMKDAKMVSCVITDLRKSLTPPPENYNLYATSSDLEHFTSTVFSFDFEWDANSEITINGVGDRFYHCLTADWKPYLPQWQAIFERATDLIGHNIISADTKYLDKMGWDIRARMHDTMLKQHLVQPDFKHALGVVASIFTNKVFWKGKGKEQEDEDGNVVETKYQWRTWDQPDAIPRDLGGYGGCVSADEAYRLYNARDVDGTFQCNEHLDQLLRQYNLVELYWNVSVPIAYICRDISDRGVRISQEKVREIRERLGQEIETLESTLPEGLAPYDLPITKSVPAPPDTYKAKSVKCRGSKATGGKHDPVEITFERPGPGIQCPHCGLEKACPKLSVVKKVKVPGVKRVRPWASSPQVMKYAKEQKLKIYVNRKRGTAAADVNARKAWGRTNPEFHILDTIKDKSTLRNTFAKEAMAFVERLYFRLNPTGTNEGRMSSAGRTKGLDPNIQNQPKEIRVIYVPDRSDYCWGELDFASGENFLTAHIANDQSRLARLRQPGYSEHLELAKTIFNVPDLTKSPHQRVVVRREVWKRGVCSVVEIVTTGEALYGTGKVINHGGNYGMTWVKLQEELEANGFFFDEAECKAFIAARKALNPDTARWQDETIERARKDGYLRNAFGRMRWFSTRDVATQSLAFLPASTLADIIIRCMIAHYPTRFAKECNALGLQVTGDLLPNWCIAIQVHDSLVNHGPHCTALGQMARTAAIMRQPWAELGGFSLDVECKIGAPGASWGELEKVKL